VNEAPLHVAVRNDWDLGTIAALLDHHADPNARRADGRTPYALAVMFGRDLMLEMLAKRGARAEISAVDALIGACLRGDAAAVRETVRSSPDIVSALGRSEFNPAEVAARENRPTALTLLAEIGFDLTRPIQEGATPLHWAAWYGRAEATRVLLRAGANKNAHDQRFDAPPIGWCAHGSLHCRAPGADYAGVTEALIAAEVDVGRGIEASDEVMAVLRKHRLPKLP